MGQLFKTSAERGISLAAEVANSFTHYGTGILEQREDQGHGAHTPQMDHLMQSYFNIIVLFCVADIINKDLHYTKLLFHCHPTIQSVKGFPG